jgi:hypothetical protein
VVLPQIFESFYLFYNQNPRLSSFKTERKRCSRRVAFREYGEESSGTNPERKTALFLGELIDQSIFKSISIGETAVFPAVDGTARVYPGFGTYPWEEHISADVVKTT